MLPQTAQTLAITFFLAAIVSFGLTPLVKVFAGKIGAIDVPKDARRMHKEPIPRLGGLAIFFGFLFAVFLMANMDMQTRGILIGATMIVVVGVIDDVTPLAPLPKFAVQILAALVPAIMGVRVEFVTNFNIFSDDLFMGFGWLSIPLTVIWIVGITNAVNFIDGLDGLACGVSGISAISILTISILVSDVSVSILSAALAGACIGFIPYNFNPAKIFMGDTGATFLGFMLATLSIQGLFKSYALVSFAVPFLIFGLPIFDTSFAIIRRIANKRSPMSPDREHLHHKLIDFGFNQKQAVAIMYLLSGVLGLAAVLLTTTGAGRALMLVAAAMIITMFSAKILEERKRMREERAQINKERLELEEKFKRLEDMQAQMGIPISPSELLEASEKLLETGEQSLETREFDEE